MNFNFIDIIILVFLIYFIWQGYHTGFIGGLLNIVSTALSFVAAIAFYPQLGQFLATKFGWSQNVAIVVAFFLILIFVEIVLSLILHQLYSIIAPFYRAISSLLVFDKILGVIPSVLVGLFLVSLF